MQQPTPYPDHRARRQQVYRAILAIYDRGEIPTITAIMAETGQNDRGQVHGYVLELAAAALVEHTPRTEGTLRPRSRPVAWVRLLDLEAR